MKKRPVIASLSDVPIVDKLSQLSGIGFGILLLALLLACQSKNGGTAYYPMGTVTGVVKDVQTGAPVAGATVSNGAATCTSDGTGRYTLTMLPGKQSLKVSASGYEPSTRTCSVSLGQTSDMDWNLTAAHGAYWDYGTAGPGDVLIPAAGMNYTILAWNDLGMHCAQDDYSYFLILPPFNTLHVQVVSRGQGIVTSGITVKYSFPKKTNSAAHTNFWTYAAAYGWNVAPNVGITGTPLAGDMQLDQNGLGFVATGIPVTPYDDDGTWNPYGTAVISVVDNLTSAVVQTAEVVAPVSTELKCSNCHSTFLDILQSHDRLNGTMLAADQAAGTLHLCAECHADNALGLAGKAGVKNLSLAVHGWHKDKMSMSTDPGLLPCYNCHPGPITQCLRGQMAHAGLSCADCHGDMNGMTAGLQAGRKPWLEEPGCGDCHGARYEENSGMLYRNSVFRNAPADQGGPSVMDGNCTVKPVTTALMPSSAPQIRRTAASPPSFRATITGYGIAMCAIRITCPPLRCIGRPHSGQERAPTPARGVPGLFYLKHGTIQHLLGVRTRI